MNQIKMKKSELDAAIADANAEAVQRIVTSTPHLIDIRPAGEMIPGLGERDLLHAGPPLPGWDVVSGALRNVVLGSLVHWKLASTIAEAERIADGGGIRLLSANDHGAGGTFAGVIGRSTPVFVVGNKTAGTTAYAAICEGRGKCLRYGANDPETLARLGWIEGEFADMLGAAIRLSGGIDLYSILVQALHMGDEGHSRQKAASALFLNTVAPFMMECGFGGKELRRALDFMARNDIFFLPLTMAAGKSTMLATEGIPYSTIVSCMAMSGVNFGIKISALGNRWFLGPLPAMNGQYFEGYGPEDANPMVGDSEVAETTGLGAFAMAAAPALARYVGGTPAEATRLSMEMYKITVAEHTRFNVPALDYRGTPCGIDLRKVVAKGITPLFNAGIAHKRPGIGQIGAGFAMTTMPPFEEALQAFDEHYR